MARGVKRLTKELIAELDVKIESFKAKIKDLESQKKELIDAERQTKLQKVLEVAEKKGLSVDDIIEKISN